MFIWGQNCSVLYRVLFQISLSPAYSCPRSGSTSFVRAWWQISFPGSVNTTGHQARQLIIQMGRAACRKPVAKVASVSFPFSFSLFIQWLPVFPVPTLLDFWSQRPLSHVDRLAFRWPPHGNSDEQVLQHNRTAADQTLLRVQQLTFQLPWQLRKRSVEDAWLCQG